MYCYSLLNLHWIVKLTLMFTEIALQDVLLLHRCVLISILLNFRRRNQNLLLKMNWMISTLVILRSVLPPPFKTTLLPPLPPSFPHSLPSFLPSIHPSFSFSLPSILCYLLSSVLTSAFPPILISEDFHCYCFQDYEEEEEEEEEQEEEEAPPARKSRRKARVEIEYEEERESKRTKLKS